MIVGFTRGLETFSVEITEKSYINLNMMGECTAFIEVFATAPITFKVGDKVILNSHTFYIKDPAIPTRDKNRLHYELTLYGVQYELEKAAFFIIDSTSESLTPDTTWECTATEFLAMLILNLDREQSAVHWQADAFGCTVTETRSLTISNNNCLEALQAAASLFECDYLVVENNISLINATEPASMTALSEGKGTGVRAISANKSNDSSIITKLYAYGSEQNTADGQRLSIDPVIADSYDCLVEGIVIFEDIYPRVTANVTGQTLLDDYAVILADHVCDLDTYRIDGLTPKLRFLTGDLAGLEFDVSNITGTTGYAIYYQTIAGNQVPGATGYNALIGDTFEIINITPPPTYLDEAKADLLAAAQQYLAEHGAKIKLNITLDEFYMQEHLLQFDLNDYIEVTSDLIPTFEAGRAIRVIGYKQYIVFPYRYENLIVGDVSLSPGMQVIIKTVQRNVTWRQVTINNTTGYRHVQSTAAATWVCVHNLEKHPAVHVTDLEGVEMLPNTVIYDSENQVTIGFAVAVAGFADFN